MKALYNVLFVFGLVSNFVIFYCIGMAILMREYHLRCFISRPFKKMAESKAKSVDEIPSEFFDLLHQIQYDDKRSTADKILGMPMGYDFARKHYPNALGKLLSKVVTK